MLNHITEITEMVEHEIDAHNPVLRRAWLTSVAVLLLAFLVSCSWTGFNLLQLAYNLNHSETFVEYGRKYKKAFGRVRAPSPPPISLADLGFVSWSTAPAVALRYKLSSILHDKDGDPGPLRSHKATVLGLRPTVSVAEKQIAPDLVPFSPSGRYRSAFCRFEQGRKLRVTVKNQGNDNAPASTTTVTFGDTPFSLDTPAIPAGGSADLLFDVPADCLSPYCSFKIMVDANSQVDELSMEGNNNVSGACLG
ncbi:MAG: CARDB domain-containing protein [Gammaproteobacteria bacterium]